MVRRSCTAGLFGSLPKHFVLIFFVPSFQHTSVAMLDSITSHSCSIYLQMRLINLMHILIGNKDTTKQDD